MHMLTSALIYPHDPDDPSTDAFALLAILAGGVEYNNLLAVLASGYLATLAPVAWSGSLPVEPDYNLAMIITGSSADQYTLAATLWPLRVDEKGEFRLDP